MNPFIWLERGGPWMYVILAVLVLGLIIVVERALALYVRTWLDPRRFLSQVIAQVETSSFARALEICNVRSGHPLPRVLKAGLMRANRREREVERAMEEELLRALPTLQSRMSYIALFANIATLIGLLGTIMGLIQAFEGINEATAAARQDVLSSGISRAMLTTAFGLITAVPMMVFHAVLTARLDRIILSVEEGAAALLVAISAKSRQGPSSNPRVETL